VLVPLSWLRDFAPFDLDPVELGEVFDNLGMVVDFAIHAPVPEKGDDPRNFHAHLLLTLRQATPLGLRRVKTREWNSESMLLKWREAWAKRRYEAHFVSKLTDCDGENGETDTCLDFARDCDYITQKEHADLVSQCEEVGKMLGSMINDPSSFLLTL